MSKNGLESILTILSDYSEKWKVDTSIGLWFKVNGNIEIDDITINDKYLDSRGYSNDRRVALELLSEEMLNKFEGDFRLVVVSKKVEQGEYGPHREQRVIHYASFDSRLVIDKLNFTKKEKEFIKDNECRDLGLLVMSTYEDKPKYISTYGYKKFENILTLQKYKEDIKNFILENFKNTGKYNLEGLY